MKTIMIDMDNVITDGQIQHYVEEFLKEKIDREEIGDYTYIQKVTESKKEAFWNYVKNKDFYKSSPLLEGCYEVLEKLNRKYDLYIVTSYLWKETIDLSGKNLQYKYNYLRKELPFIPPEKYIFTTNKKIIPFDIKIDDRIDNLENGKMKLLFQQWHNKNISSEELKKKKVILVKNWKEIEKILHTKGQ